jgi:hypothetical protein
MSFRLEKEVWELALSPGEKLVLLAYATFANDAGEHVYPSASRVAKMTGYHVDTVGTHTKALRERGLLNVREYRRAKGKPNVYSIRLPKGAGPDTPPGVSPEGKASNPPANVREVTGELPVSSGEISGPPPGRMPDEPTSVKPVKEPATDHEPQEVVGGVGVAQYERDGQMARLANHSRLERLSREELSALVNFAAGRVERGEDGGRGLAPSCNWAVKSYLEGGDAYNAVHGAWPSAHPTPARSRVVGMPEVFPTDEAARKGEARRWLEAHPEQLADVDRIVLERLEQVPAYTASENPGVQTTYRQEYTFVEVQRRMGPKEVP